MDAVYEDYFDPSKPVSAENRNNFTITFTNERGNEQWLDGDSWCDNRFN